jgi:hypothetical protein
MSPAKEMTKPAPTTLTPSELITQHIAGMPGWRGQLYARLRKLVLKAAPSLAEDWKWGTGVWTQKANVLAIAAMKDHLKINFFKGAALDDPHGLFNAGLEAKATRAIDLFEGDKVNEAALADLVRAAVALDAAGGKKK